MSSAGTPKKSEWSKPCPGCGKKIDIRTKLCRACRDANPQ